VGNVIYKFILLSNKASKQQTTCSATECVFVRGGVLSIASWSALPH